MILNLQDLFLKAFAGISVLLGVLWAIKNKLAMLGGALGTALRAARNILTFAATQVLLNLLFLLSYVFFVKNGTVPNLSDISVGFTVICPVAYFVLWRYGALSHSSWTLVAPGIYSAFLLYRFFISGVGVGFFGYLLYNPLFGLIGSTLTGGKRALGAVSAVLPFACAALGRGLALKRIDKRRKLCHNVK